MRVYLEECNEKSNCFCDHTNFWCNKNPQNLNVCMLFAGANNSIVGDNHVNTSVIANIVNSELPSVRKKERDYVGMFEFSSNDTQTILKALVIGKKLLYG